MRRLLFALLLAVSFIACNKNKSQCNVEPEKINITLMSESIEFGLYNEETNILVKPLVNKDLLNSLIELLGIDIIDSINATNNIVGIALLMNSSDTSIMNNLTQSDINGILFYVNNNTNDGLSTIVYRKNPGSISLMFDEYLSTTVNYASITHIEVLSTVLSNGINNNLKLFIVRNNEGYFSQPDNKYSEFYYRILHLGTKSNVTVSTVPKCGGICMVEQYNTYCIWGDPYQYCHSDPSGGGTCYYGGGLQTATPINYSVADCEATFDLQRQLRDNVLLKSQKGVTYTSLYYFISSKMTTAYYISNINLMFDVVFNSVMPMISKINDESYNGVLYDDSDLNNFVNIIESLQSELNDDDLIVTKLEALKQDLIEAKGLDKQTILNTFYDH